MNEQLKEAFKQAGKAQVLGNTWDGFRAYTWFSFHIDQAARLVIKLDANYGFRRK